MVAGFIVLSTGITYAQSASGQSANGFRISPVRNDITIEKGTSRTLTIMVENPSNLPLKAKAVINDFIASATESGEPQLLLDGNDAPSHSLRKLVQAVPVTDLAPNERKEVKVTIVVPVNAAAGGYYGAVRFLPADTKSGANVALTASVGSIFLVNVPGNIKEHLELVQFSAASNGIARSVITSGQVSIITRLRNDGDTHEKPFGNIQVKNSKGKVVAEQEINNIEPKSNVLPSSIRKFETKLKDSKWFGHYTVTASFGYDPSDSALINAKTSFWYVPAWLLAVIAVAAVAVIFAVYIIIRKMRRRSKRHQ